MTVPRLAVAVVNRSTVLADDAIAPIVTALQTQVSRDFAPIWGVDATLTFVGLHDKPAAKAWQLVVLDDSDQAGALGYHDLTAADKPIGKVFAKTDLTYKALPSVTISHELLEMLGDPDINKAAEGPDGFYAYEACDAVEADQLGYKIGAVTVSDFVTPAYFSGHTHAKTTKIDFCGHLKRPFTLAPGGYASIYVPGKGWTQKTASLTTSAQRPAVGSRRERRRTPRDQWISSTAR